MHLPGVHPGVKRFLAVLVVAAGLILGLGVLGLGPLQVVFHRSISASAHGGVAEIWMQPIPEGPAVGFGSTPIDSKPLRLVARFIPNPLPGPLYQGPFCHLGGDLVLTFADGKQVTYGPCHRPSSIDHLWAEMIYVLDPSCTPRCGPGGAPGP
jgi:hypothetical protein